MKQGDLIDRIIAGLEADIYDRSGLGNELESCDKATRDEIRAAWREILTKELGMVEQLPLQGVQCIDKDTLKAAGLLVIPGKMPEPDEDASLIADMLRQVGFTGVIVCLDKEEFPDRTFTIARFCQVAERK